MYITSYKKEQAPQFSAIDALFAGETDIDMNVEPSSDVLRTHTKWVALAAAYSSIPARTKLLELDNMLDRILCELPNPENEYTTFNIRKKTHGFRTINAPKPNLKKEQKTVANYLSHTLKVLTHDSAWAYVSGRSVVEAMKEHTNNQSKWYLKIDLHDFFGSCNPEFIKEQLMKLYPFASYPNILVVDKIIKLATLNNGLPQGTPLSPVLTNLIMVEFDYKINRMLYNLTQEHGLFKQRYIYTRYADDIIISAKNKFDFNIVVNAIKELFDNTPLSINEEKTRFGSSSGRNWNLGIMCNKNNELTVGYRRKHKIKTVIHSYVTSRDTGNAFNLEDLQWLLGELSWIRNVEPNYFDGLNNYLYNKYGFNVVDTIIQDIKSYTI